jgi:6-phosphofructokinase 1
MGLNLRSVHVPKTIDNDLPLPEGIPTFGFETARALGARLVTTIMEDALTTQHWFLVVTMGRSSGHLALGIGKSAGATLTIIPEEWQGQPIHLQEVVDILVTSIILRAASDRPHGVAVIAEGVASNLVAEELRKFEGVSLGEFEHIKLEDIKLSDVLKRAVRRDLGKLGMDKVQLRDKEMGYELRCAEPIAYDVDYARSLGQAATDFLLSGDSNATISLQFNQVKAIPSEEIIDVQTGKIQVRKVNIDSFAYRSAYNFMIRLKPEHAHDPLLLERMARQTNKSTEEFIARYGYLVGLAPRPPEVG